MNGLLHSTLQHILMKLDSYTLVWVVAICLFSCEETAPYVSAMATQTFKLVKKGREKKWTASVHTLHMSKPVMTFVFKVLRNGLLRCILYTTYTLHMSKPVMTFVSKVLRNGLLRYILYTHVQTCDDVRVQSSTEWTASVHTLHMSKPVMTFVFKVLRNGLLHLTPVEWHRLILLVTLVTGLQMTFYGLSIHDALPLFGNLLHLRS